MSKKLTGSEIEKKVYNHIIKSTNRGYTFDFNPMDLSTDGIAVCLDLSVEEVEEAINKLKGDWDSTNIERIQAVKPRFEIWIPNTEKGKEVLDGLCNSGMAVKSSMQWFYTFLLLAAAYIFTFEIPVLVNWLSIKTMDSYFLWSVVFTTISFKLGSYLAHKWYQINSEIEKVRGIKYYIYVLIALVSGSIYFWTKGVDVGLIITSIGTITNIVIILIQIIKKK